MGGLGITPRNGRKNECLFSLADYLLNNNIETGALVVGLLASLLSLAFQRGAIRCEDSSSLTDSCGELTPTSASRSVEREQAPPLTLRIILSAHPEFISLKPCWRWAMTSFNTASEQVTKIRRGVRSSRAGITSSCDRSDVAVGSPRRARSTLNHQPNMMEERAVCWFPAAQPWNNHIDTVLIKSLVDPLALASYWLTLTY
ncbi:uncharacterized protein [Alexandromys fortis]|uniref:uncharacterized protein isoform X2 n=1 Tax=Alexandromys fortis TaxID=100897 RepID=UPI002152D066|nr:uncharacterized protein LOC126501048 isoform X2 [Microtus fortis]